MPAEAATDHDGEVPNLQQLITEKKRLSGLSYAVYEQRTGHVVSRQRWQQLATGERIKEFSEPATIQAMADALEVDVAVVLLAMAKTLGLSVETGIAQSELAVMLPPSARNLDAEQRDAIVRLVRVFAPPKESLHALPSDSTTEPDAQTQGRQAQEAALHRPKLDTRIGLRGPGVQKPRKRHPK